MVCYQVPATLGKTPQGIRQKAPRATIKKSASSPEVTTYSYLVARDWGFAPNPFFGYCTIACCKPTIRRVAKEGDLIIGTGTKSKGRSGQLIFAMRVTEKISFEEYWEDPRFFRKRPIMHKSRMLKYGDNIYRPDGNGGFTQLFSHHSLFDGSTNHFNREKDTGSNNVLISDEFVYFGERGPIIPDHLRDFDGVDICAPTQGHISNKISKDMEDATIEWLETMGWTGFSGRPSNWSKSLDKP
ncbi:MULTISPECIES: hypothetical protein [unclassified Sphingopyxis]|uniref:Nmad2 family putative nucleotide modification protein n=1 Tax=unclassified Sphingopyxis TaxID=2614943 RepID=UPI000A448B0D|nr:MULTISPECIES: hypothetical protein [unclassified Sphingopyxis]